MGVVFYILSSVIFGLELIILVECLLSWFVQGRGNEIMNLLRIITNPILEPFRRLQNQFFGDVAIDFSPILAIVALQILKRIIYIVF
ncbi:YggT family protein [Clostridium paraputrificum]|uniref:YggT family protein n=1 Tax=Clostridium TaxID=1485 RepID=UPI003D3529AD